MRTAILYSLAVSWQRHGKDLLAYLHDILNLPLLSYAQLCRAAPLQ